MRRALVAVDCLSCPDADADIRRWLGSAVPHCAKLAKRSSDPNFSGSDNQFGLVAGTNAGWPQRRAQFHAGNPAPFARAPAAS